MSLVGSSLLSKRLDIEDTIERLTLSEKVSLTAGRDFWHTTPIPRLGIPSIRLSDGPNGIRGTRFFDSIPAACLPCGTAIGATFDTDLAKRIGNLLGDEAKAKGAHVVLGPTINIQRGPLGGRGFESFSEDPFLSGNLAGNYCNGLKEKDIVATLKHFVCNDQEHERMAVNSIVTDRALREIYLMPFQIAITLARPGAIMTAYNKVNGTHVAEDKKLLQDILRDEWKWDGLVMSDWFGTYSTTEAIDAGLDLEMPGPSRWRGPALVHAISANKIPETVLDNRVRAVLKLINLASESGVPENAPESILNRREDQELLCQVAAESIVLLKNEDSILPFSKTNRVAVIGPNAKIATICGGGSASLNPYHAVTPYDGISAQATAGVDFCQGAYGHQSLPELGELLKTADGLRGFTLKVFNESPHILCRKLLEERRLTNSMIHFLDYDHPDLEPIWYADVEGYFTPEESGIFDFGLAVQGTAKLYIDDKILISNVEDQKSGSSFLGSGTVEETGTKELTAGQSYKISVQWGCAKTSKLQCPGTVDFGHGGLRFSGCKRLDEEIAIQQAVELARNTEQTVLLVGLSGAWESEGSDRDTMALPLGSDELISRVLKANPRTVVVVQSGTPVQMPWADRAKSILQAWYGGNETGNGIAEVVFGKTNPSAKLPLTIPRRIQDNPTYLNYRSEGGRVLYGEDVYVGYRWYDQVEIPPLFSFGHGLSYTTFSLRDIHLSGKELSEIKVEFDLLNTGSCSGAEVVQLYISPISPAIRRPVKELKAFQKIFADPGQSVRSHMILDVQRSTSFWDEKRKKWCSHAGSYKILLGASSEGPFIEAVFDLPKTSYWLGL